MTKWFVAVTTAPRDQPTIETCLQSIRDAGWEEPVVFAEPGSKAVSCLTHWNTERKGVWYNWLGSALTALQSDAELILTAQDDTLFHPDSKEYVESILWPSHNTGFISLYTPMHYAFKDEEEREPGVFRFHTFSLWGACALVWPREVLEAVVTSETARDWRGVPPKHCNTKNVFADRGKNPWKIKHADTAIGFAVNHLQRSMWYIHPSPVQHIAEVSSVGNGGNTGFRNCYQPAFHNEPLHLQAPPPENLQHLSPVNQDELGSFNISEELIDKIKELLPNGGKILELGSGAGTKKIVEAGYQVVSIEDDDKWVGFCKSNTYIHAPLVNGWYDTDRILSLKNLWDGYDLLLVDGPRCQKNEEPRKQLLKHRWILNNSPIIVDDTQRKAERELAYELAKSLDRSLSTTVCSKYKKWFSVIEGAVSDPLPRQP